MVNKVDILHDSGLEEEFYYIDGEEATSDEVVKALEKGDFKKMSVTQVYYLPNRRTHGYMRMYEILDKKVEVTFGEFIGEKDMKPLMIERRGRYYIQKEELLPIIEKIKEALKIRDRDKRVRRLHNYLVWITDPEYRETRIREAMG